MTEITLHLEPAVVLFYTRIAESIGIPLETVLTDALFKLAGELSFLSALNYTTTEVKPPDAISPRPFTNKPPSKPAITGCQAIHNSQPFRVCPRTVPNRQIPISLAL